MVGITLNSNEYIFIGKRNIFGFISRNPDGPYTITCELNRYFANGNIEIKSVSEEYGFRLDDLIYLSYENTATSPDFIFKINEIRTDNRYLRVNIVAYDDTKVGKQKYRPSTNIHPYDIKIILKC